MRPGPRPLLLDTDPGLDDALALAALCASSEVDLKAAIAVGGNVPAARTVRNLRGLLRLFGRADVPVARGLEAPCAISAAHVHGSDGLAGLAARLDADRSPPLRIRGGGGSAVAGLRSIRNPQSPIRNLLSLKPCLSWRRLVRETLRALPDRSVDLLALGPLTDLAALARFEHRLLSRKLRAVVLMAGSILEAGNVAPMVEFNVACDPSAAARVLASGWPIRLVPLDATQCVTFGPELAECLAARGTLVGRVLACFVNHLRSFREPAAQRVWSEPQTSNRRPQTSPFRAFIHDAVAACALVRPEFFAWERLPLKVVTRGAARGVVLSDRRRRTGSQQQTKAARGTPPADWPKVEVALRADARRVYEWISERLARVADGGAVH